MYRRRAGLVQPEIATLIGIESPASVKRYEAGDALPNLRTAIALAIALNQPVEEVFAGIADDAREDIARRAAALLEAMTDEPTHENILKLETLSRLAHPDDEPHLFPCEDAA
jgi:DNA-binding XRE family transcriptional regulator